MPLTPIILPLLAYLLSCGHRCQDSFQQSSDNEHLRIKWDKTSKKTQPVYLGASPIKMSEHGGSHAICVTKLVESLDPDWLPRPFKWDPDTAAFFLDDKTAPELLRELVGYYGLKGYSIGPDIDTTRKGILCLGYVTKATPIGVWVSELGRMHKNLHFMVADDSIFVSRTPFIDSLNSHNPPY